MKNIYKISGVILFIFLIYCCKKEKHVYPILPDITTSIVTDISYTTAASGGNVTNDGGAPVTSRGVCWDTSYNPTIENSKTIEGSGSGLFTSNISQLVQNTFYYLRAYAINSAGTAYGNQENFTTRWHDQPGTVTDADGNFYDTIAIGPQTWMKENLKSTKYESGEPIPMVTDDLDWFNLTRPGAIAGIIMI